MQKYIVSAILILLFSGVTIAQNVGINTPSPTSSLDINGGHRLRSALTTVSGASVMIASNRAHHVLIGGSVDFTISFIDATLEGQHVIITNNTLYKGFLVPIHIQPGTTVELIYSTLSWKLIGTNEAISNTAWSRTGNGGTIDGVNNYIGTTDAKPIRFIENGTSAGLLDAARGSYFFGGLAGINTQPGTSANSGFGNWALFKTTTGNNNTAIGSHSLFSNLKGNNNTAVGVLALNKDTAANEVVAIGAEALHWNQARFGNTAVGTKALYNNTNPDKFIIPIAGGVQNTAIGHSALYNNRSGYNNVAVGYEAAYNNEGPFGIVAIGNKALHSDESGNYSIAIGNEAASKAYRGRGTIAIGFHAFDSTANGSSSGFTNWNNIAIGTGSMRVHNQNTENVAIGAATLTKNVDGNKNVVVGAQALQLQTIGSLNVVVGAAALLYNTAGDNNVALGFGSFQNLEVGSNSVGLGYKAGYNETTSNKLYIENSDADKNNALIFGDFAADSLLLNAKTVVRNNAVVRGFTKLGGYASDVPAIKTKKITGTGPAVNGNMPVPHGLNAIKIISVQIYMQYGASPTPTKVLPPNYTVLAGYEYQYEIDGANILISNKGANSSNIGSKSFRMFITYEE